MVTFDSEKKSGKYLSSGVLSSLSIMHIDVVSQAFLTSWAITLNRVLRDFLALDAGKSTLQI